MREIKFRGRRVDNGEWVYGFLAGRAEIRVYHTYINYTVSSWTDFEVVPETVGQFTGLNVDGEEIYEGDIVNDLDEPKVIELKNGSFGIHEKGKPIILYSTSWKVIGNIHENHELIK